MTRKVRYVAPIKRRRLRVQICELGRLSALGKNSEANLIYLQLPVQVRAVDSLLQFYGRCGKAAVP